MLPMACQESIMLYIKLIGLQGIERIAEAENCKLKFWQINQEEHFVFSSLFVSPFQVALKEQSRKQS